MKKILFLMVSLFIAIASFALDTNGNYGFKQQTTADGYQQYVGQTFYVRPAYGSLETWEKSGFKPKDENFDVLYKITKVTVKDVVLNDKPNKEITIEAVQDGGKKKIKFKGYEEVSLKVGFWGDIKKWPLIGWMPVVLAQPFNDFKSNNIGQNISHKVVKDQYEILDAYIGKPDERDGGIGVVRLKVKNNRTGEVKDIENSSKYSAPFEDALKGSYKMALIKVEKPEDSGERYSEVKTIQDASVEKYSFSDDIISIIIFGDNEQFNYELKNMSSTSIKVIWNEAAFVGLDGKTSKIMHVGTKFSERESDQPATTIIKGAKIDDVATPTANVYYDEGYTIGYHTYGNGWKKHSMLPLTYKGKEAGEIRLMLPIQVKDVVNEYTFVFKVYYTYDHPELLRMEE